MPSGTSQKLSEFENVFVVAQVVDFYEVLIAGVAT